MEAEREEGLVIETHGNTATVRINKASACAHCKAGCTEQGGVMIAKAENSVGAQVGDTVRLKLNPEAALTAILVVFGLPILALLFGAILATVVAARMGYQNHTQLLSVGTGAILFFLTFIPIRAYDRRIKKSRSHDIVVLGVLKKAAS